MKITIDTKEDSHEEIKKIIKMLSSLAGEDVVSNQGNIFSEDTSKPESPDMFNMFNNSDSESKTDETKKEEDVDLGIPRVEDY